MSGVDLKLQPVDKGVSFDWAESTLCYLFLAFNQKLCAIFLFYFFLLTNCSDFLEVATRGCHVS